MLRAASETNEIALSRHPPDFIGMDLVDQSPVKTTKLMVHPDKTTHMVN